MFEFHWPWMALLLLLPPLAWLFWPRRPRDQARPPAAGQRTTLLHPSIGLLQASFGARRVDGGESGRLRLLLQLALWTALTLALMRPQWLEPYHELRDAGYDLLLAVDTSRSMTALDFTRNGAPVSRMSVVKGVMGQFIERRDNDRIGLIVFGNQAFVQSPLTLDRRAVREILDQITPGMAGNATAMGDAIGLGVAKLRERPPGSRVLLLVTDGESTSGMIPPLDAARLAAREGVRIYAIGVGSNKQEVMLLGSDGQYRLEQDVGLDETTLTRIAEQTGGAYFRATNTQALEQISKRIDTLERTQAESRSVLIPRPLYRWPLGVALALLLLIGLFPDGRLRRSGAAR